MKKEADKTLSAKQKRFCQEYLIDSNGSAAAERAGYSPKTAKEQASRLLTKVYVQQYISDEQARLKALLEEKFFVSKERVLGMLSRIAFADIRSLYNEDGTLRKVHELDPDEAVPLAGIEVYEEFAFVDGDRVPMGQTKKVRTYDKIKAAIEINKMLGYNSAEKSESVVHVTITENDVEAFEKKFNSKYLNESTGN